MSSSADPRQRAAASGVSRTMRKFEERLAQRQFYEAQQMARTLATRYVTQGNVDGAMDLLYQTAMGLYDADEATMGADLAEMWADTARNGNVPADHVPTIDRAALLLSHTPGVLPQSIIQTGETKDNSEGATSSACTCDDASSAGDGRHLSVLRHKFVEAALGWSKHCAVADAHKRHGHARLHDAFAKAMWHEANYKDAHGFFFWGSDGESYGAMLAEYEQKEAGNEGADLWIAKIVLQLLCCRRRDMAKQTFRSFCGHHPSISESFPFSLPLLNFVHILLDAIDNKKLDWFAVIVEKYNASLERDPVLKRLLDKIAQIYFGAPPPQSSNNMIENLFKGLMGGPAEGAANGANEDDEFLSADEAEPTATPASGTRRAAASMVDTDDLD